MSGLNPCDPNTAYETSHYVQIIGFCVAIGSLAVVVFKAEEDVLRIVYWAVIYSKMENNLEKAFNCIFLAITGVLTLATATSYISCTLYYAGITVENALPTQVDGNYGYNHGINIMFLIAQLPALIVMMEFDDIIRGHIRFDNNTGTTIFDVLKKVESGYFKFYQETSGNIGNENQGNDNNNDSSRFSRDKSGKKAARVEVSAVKLAKIVHHLTLVVVVFCVMVVIFDVTETFDIKFIDFYDKNGECQDQNTGQ